MNYLAASERGILIVIATESSSEAISQIFLDSFVPCNNELKSRRQREILLEEIKTFC